MWQLPPSSDSVIVSGVLQFDPFSLSKALSCLYLRLCWASWALGTERQSSMIHPPGLPCVFICSSPMSPPHTHITCATLSTMMSIGPDREKIGAGRTVKWTWSCQCQFVKPEFQFLLFHRCVNVQKCRWARGQIERIRHLWATYQKKLPSDGHASLLCFITHGRAFRT